MPLDPLAALVTGAGRGLGRAHALALAARGVAIVVNDLDPAPAAAVVAEIEAAGGRAVADTTDIASREGGRAAVAASIAAFGRIDVLVNNAGFAEGDLEALLDVHLRGPLGAMDAAIDDMRPRRWGRIVNTVSEVALDDRFAGPVAYGAAKAALWSATLATAAAVRHEGITVNALSPGARTRLSEPVLTASTLDLAPEHVARVVAYLCSDEADDITGRVVHAAAGQIREYTTTRSASTPLAERLTRSCA